MMGTGLGLAAPLGLATKVYADFEQHMARTGVLLGLQKTEAAFVSLSDKAKQLGRDTEWSAGDAAEAMSLFAARGFRANEILKAVDPTLALATAGMLSLADSTKVVSSIMHGMGEDVGQLSAITDILATAATKSGASVADLGKFFEVVGSSARTAGFSLEEVAAAGMVLANAGISAERGATGLRGIMQTLANPSAEGRKEMDRLGIAIDAAGGKFMTLADLLDQFDRATAGKGPLEKMQSLGKILPARQEGILEALLGEDMRGVRGVEQIREALKMMEGAAGLGKRVRSGMLDTLTGAWKLFTSAIEGTALVIGEALAPALRRWGEGLVKITNAVTQIATVNAAWIPAIGETAVNLIVVGGALWGAGAAFKVLAFGLGWTTTLAVVGSKAFFGLGRALIFCLNPLGLLKTVLITLPLAVVKYGAIGVALAMAGIGSAVMFLLSPLGLVTAAFAGLATWFVFFSDTGRSAWGELGSGFVALGNTIKTTWKGVVDAFMAGDLRKAGQIAFKGLHIMWNQLIIAMSNTWDAFTTQLMRLPRLTGVLMEEASGKISKEEADKRIAAIRDPKGAKIMEEDKRLSTWLKELEARKDKMTDAEWDDYIAASPQYGPGGVIKTPAARAWNDPKSLAIAKKLGVEPRTLGTKDERPVEQAFQPKLGPWELETQKLQDELRELTDAAAAAREEFEKKGQPVEDAADPRRKLTPALPTPAEVTQSVATATQGTFSGDVAQRLGGENTAADLQRETNRKLDVQTELEREAVRILRDLLKKPGGIVVT